MRSLLSTAASLLPLFYTKVCALPQTTTSSTACNNSPALCSQPYANVTYLGAHDSPFTSNSSNSYDVSGNQYFNTTVQLNAGVRLLQAQMQRPNSSDPSQPIHLCHTSCNLYDAGTLENWLGEVKAWMDSNPNEVVTILLVNGPGATAAELGPIFTGSGITQYSYTPTSAATSTWPTLQEMISANTRLVTFIASLTDNSGATFLLNEWDYMWENNYQVTTSSNFTCTPDRPSSLQGSLATAASSGRMFMMNHFLYLQQLFNIQTPDVDNLGTTNSPDTNTIGSLGYSADQCTSQYGTKPTFVLVDFFNVGPAISTVDRMNQVTGQISGRQAVTTSNMKVESESTGAAGRIERSAFVLALGFACALSAGWL